MKKTVLTLLAAFTLLAAQAKIIYVDIDATGADDGSSWTDAYTDANRAFTFANFKDEVWIKSGTYLPHPTLRTSSFELFADKVKIYGGFDGTETSVDDRKSSTAPTILSGDIGVKGDATDNSYTIFKGKKGTAFTYADSTWVDGVTISDGYANVPTLGNDLSTSSGGGFYLQEYAKHIQFTNCKFTNNYALFGGAICLYKEKTLETSVLFYNCSFTDNSASSNSFAYMYTFNDEPLNAYFINCLIADNHSVAPSFTSGSLINFTSASKFANLWMYSTTITGNTTDADTSRGNVALITAGKELSASGATNIVLLNSIVYSNEVNTYLQKDRSNFLPNAALANCIIEENQIPTGLPTFDMIYEDPDFIGGAGHQKYMPSRKSPAIDASKAETANTNAVFTATDLAGNPRPADVDSIDLGCYENPDGKEVVKTSVQRYNILTATVYPNPATNTISIKGLKATAQVSILNTLGAEVLRTSSTQNIDVSSLPAGLYTLITTQDDIISQAKFIKQ